MTNNHQTTSNESGNILIYILGAIFLLGLLVVLVKGSSSPGSNIDEEGLMIKVAEVQQYGNELESAVAIIMSNGFSESDIRFAHPDAASSYGDITDTPTRQVFSKQGGGATFRAPPTGVQTTVTPWTFNAENWVPLVGTGSGGCGGSSCVDLIAFLPYVSQSFCNIVNDKNDITGSSGPPPPDNGTVDITAVFTGSFNASYQIYDSGKVLGGEKEGCFEGGGATPPAGTYHYYRVLMAR